MNRHNIILLLAIFLVVSLSNACTTVLPKPSVQLIQADQGVELTPAILEQIKKEYDLAQASFEAGDYSGAEMACEQAGRLIYGVKNPEDRYPEYFELQSKISLLTVRINKIQHGLEPEIDQERFTMPIPYNPRIEQQLKLFITGGRESFARWLRRSGKYVQQLKHFFTEAGLPEDLVYVALIESGFNPRNRSSKQAVGLFQFIPSTADMVGLKETLWLDERRDPEKAAEAAVKHIQALYKTFQDWDLVLAAYNAGAGRVKNAMKNQGHNDYWELSLPPETEAYVPRFYAATIIAREPEMYGFNPKLDDNSCYEDVSVPGSVDLNVVADAIGVSVNVVKDLNPELTKGCTPPGEEPYLLKLPANSEERFNQQFAQLPENKKFLSQEEMAKRKFEGIYFIYKVKPGDSLYTIAKKYHTTLDKLTKWNASIKKKKYIHPGEKLRIYRMR